MNATPHTQAVLLLTAHFSKPRPDDAKPLTPTEWGRFALWLRDRNLPPEALLSGNVREKLADWTDAQISLERIGRLLDRGSALAIAMEKWLRSGLWILTRSDTAYPSKLKQRLRTAAPPVLFGCGNAKLLESRSVAVVGSRNASDEDLRYSRRIGELGARVGLTVVSGGARGVDEAAMLGALEADGAVVGVLADSLLRASSSMKFRKHLMSDSFVLISPYYPDAGFSAGNAMGRNKYVYCLADAAIVVHSGANGGTWSGALENLARSWVPLWVKRTDDRRAGNEALAARGGGWLPAEPDEIAWERLTTSATPSPQPERVDMFAADGRIAESVPSELRDSLHVDASGADETALIPAQSSANGAFYQLFLQEVAEVCRDEAQTPAELERRLEVGKAQVAAWLKRAVSDGRLEKLTRPTRYRWIGQNRQQSIF